MLIAPLYKGALNSIRDTLKKSSFPRRRESRGFILLGFVFGKHDFSESISASFDHASRLARKNGLLRMGM